MQVESKQGVISTPHPLASESGLRVLEGGGTAIDAVLAAGATLAVVYPHMTGIGGDALWLLHDSRVRCVTGIGQAGQRLPEGGLIGLRGSTSVATTAGALASWHRVQQISRMQWGSRWGWSDLLEDAIHWAERGVPVSRSQQFWQTHRQSLLDSLPDLARLTRASSGNLLVQGELLRQPQLAATLRQLARKGVLDFYSGELAAALAEGFSTIGCGLTAADMAATQAPEVTPLAIRYRQGHLYNFPPPTQGLYTLQALLALDQMPLAAMGNGSADYYHALVEAIKPALQRRNRELCDPAINGWEFTASLDTQSARAYCAAINPQAAATWGETGRPADTVWLAATDKEGRTACLMQSLFHDFGSGCLIGDTGVLWHNRASGFDRNSAHINTWAPGKRPAHTLNPSCYLADDGRRFFFGSQGGDGQPQTQLVLATQLIDFQMNISDALGAPRFLLGRSFFDSNDNLKLEANISDLARTELIRRGHEVEMIPKWSPYCGEAGVISIARNGLRSVMHDPRGDGCALGQCDI